jgi:predicted site-specific integrase-resolvase
MIYGYARVSTGGQSEAAQVRQLHAAGAAKVFREVASGAKTDRSRLRSDKSMRALVEQMASLDGVSVPSRPVQISGEGLREVARPDAA